MNGKSARLGLGMLGRIPSDAPNFHPLISWRPRSTPLICHLKLSEVENLLVVIQEESFEAE